MRTGLILCLWALGLAMTGCGSTDQGDDATGGMVGGDGDGDLAGDGDAGDGDTGDGDGDGDTAGDGDGSGLRTCDDVQQAFEAALQAAQQCTTDDECGQVLTGTSCGCTRNLVARWEADDSELRALMDLERDGERCVELVSSCDCPEANGFLCDAGTCAWNYVDSAPPVLTPQECEAEGGVPLADPGDGSLNHRGCPRGRPALGSISGYDEGGLCCELSAADCAPQAAHAEGPCTTDRPIAFDGFGCGPAAWANCDDCDACQCVGPDCERMFASQAACDAYYFGCQQVVTACGGWAGLTCTDSEYCAYADNSLCGATDGSAICQPRPIDCSDAQGGPVCGCDGKTYQSACEAAKAGYGFGAFGGCG